MATFIATTILGLTGTAATIAAGVINLGVAYGISRAVSGGPSIDALQDPGVATRVPANPENRVPVVYGRARVKGTVFYGDISDDNQSLALLVGISEGPINMIGDIYWDGYRLVFDAAGNVTDAIDENGMSNDFLNGNVQIVTNATGGRSAEMEAFSTRWAIGAENRTMPDMAYAFIRVNYDRENGVTGITNALTFDVQGRLVRTFDADGNLGTTLEYSTNPAECLLDYMTNTRYGPGNVTTDFSLNLASFAAHAAFCDTMLPHINTEGTEVFTERYTCNGVVNTRDNADDIIGDFLACSSAILAYAQGEFFLNTDTVGTSVMSFDDDNIYGGVVINEEGFDIAINELEVEYISEAENHQADQVFISAPQARRNQNEPELNDRLILQFTNNNIEAERLGTILLNKSRNSQTITFSTDERALRLQPNDIIEVTRDQAAIADKLYRVLTVSETQIPGGANGFSISAQEYAAADYDDLMLVERDPAPNTTLPTPRSLPAVTDLIISEARPGASIPNFDLRWTVPATGIFEEFRIFYNPNNTVFDSSATIFLRSVTPSGGASNFTSGSVITETISGLPSGTYNIWVVGRNGFARSPESNRASIIWNPQAGFGIQAIRHHDNPVGTQPDNPAGFDGTDNGWYDPVVGSPITTNRPDDQNPHWEATGFGVEIGGIQEITDFAITGTGGVQTTVTTPAQQRVNFDLSGTIGERELTTPERPEITEFTFTGQAAEAVGSPEYWALDFTGSSDATVPAGDARPEEFFIYLNGNSSTDVPPFYESTFTAPRTSSGSGARFPFLDNAWSTETRMDLRGASAAQRLELFNGLNTGNTQPNTGSVSNTNGYRLAITNTNRSNWGIYDFNSISGINVGSTSDILFFSSFSFVAGQGSPTTNEQYQILFLDENATTIPMPSEVEIAIPEFITPETFQLTNDLTTSTALRDDLFNRLMDTFGTPVTISETFAMETDASRQSLPLVYVRTASQFRLDNWPSDSTGRLVFAISGSDTTLMSELINVTNGGTFEVLDGNTVVFAATITFRSFGNISLSPDTDALTLTIDDITVGAGDAVPAAGTQLTLRHTPLVVDSRINNFFTITQGTATFADHGVQDGEPIILFVADRNQDVSVGVTFTSGNGGDLSNSAFGSHIEGVAEGVSTEIRITYDPDLTPSFQDIVIGQANDAAAIATTVASMVNAGHNEVTATQGTAEVLREATGDISQAPFWDILGSVGRTLFSYNINQVDFQDADITTPTTIAAADIRFMELHFVSETAKDSFINTINTETNPVPNAFVRSWTETTTFRQVLDVDFSTVVSISSTEARVAVTGVIDSSSTSAFTATLSIASTNGSAFFRSSPFVDYTPRAPTGRRNAGELRQRVTNNILDTHTQSAPVTRTTAGGTPNGTLTFTFATIEERDAFRSEVDMFDYFAWTTNANLADTSFYTGYENVSTEIPDEFSVLINFRLANLANFTSTSTISFTIADMRLTDAFTDLYSLVDITSVDLSENNSGTPTIASVTDITLSGSSSNNFNIFAQLAERMDYLVLDVPSENGLLIYEINSISSLFTSTARFNITYVGSTLFVDDTRPFPRITANTVTAYGLSQDVVFENREAVRITEDTTSSRVVVQTNNDGAFDEPVLSITERGTSAAFTQEVSTILEGMLSVDGTLSSYSVVINSVVVASGQIISNSNAVTFAEQIREVINSLTEYRATRVNNVLTTTSEANTSEDILILITTGSNDTGSSSTNDLAVSRSVLQNGSTIDVFTGEDAMITIRLGDTVLETLNVSSLTLNSIAVAIGNAYATDARFNAQVNGTQIQLFAQFTGTDNPPMIDVTPGILSTGAQATLTAQRTVINNGEDITTTGEVSQLTATVGDVSVSADISSGASSVDVASELATLINDLQSYSGVVSPVSTSTARATSVRAEDTADINVTVSRVGTGGTILIARSQVQNGTDAAVDLTGTVWTIRVINQEVRVDDDTTMMGSNNEIEIRRGIIEDVQTWDDISGVVGPNGENADNGIAYLRESFTTSDRSTQVVFTSNMLGSGTVVTTGTIVRLSYVLDFRVDGETTWTEGLESYRLALTGAVNGFTGMLPVSFSNTATMLLPSTTYWIRVRRVFTLNSGVRTVIPTTANLDNFLVNSLAIEELIPTP